jgi:hypothetical protein
MDGVAQMRRRDPEPPPGPPRIEFKPGMANEMLRDLAPLLAEEGIDIENTDALDMQTLQRAMNRAVERRNMELFTPVGETRDLAAAALRLVVEALAEDDSSIASSILDQVQPESPGNSAPTVSACIGLALGLLDEWLGGNEPTTPARLAQRVRLPKGHWQGERAARDILALAGQRPGVPVARVAHHPPGWPADPLDPIDDQRLVRTQPPGNPRGVHRGVAAAVHGHPPADHRPRPRRDTAQERHRVHDPARFPGRDFHPLGQVRADRDEDRVEPALAPLRLQVVDPVAAGDPHTQRGDPLDLDGQHVPRQPVGWDAVAHHPAGFWARVADLDLVSEPRQVVRRGKPAGSRAHHQYPLSGQLRWRAEQLPLLDGEVPQEPLDPVD